MVERIRTEFQRVMTGEGGGKRMSQAELDAYRRQLVLLAVTGTAILVVLILGIGASYQYLYLPRQSVADVGGQTINRSDYWDYRKYQLLLQINQYQQMAQMMEDQQAQQYQQLAQEANQEFQNIEDADVDPMTLDEMIDNRIVTDGLEELDLEITDQEVDDYLVEYFAGTPVGGESPGPEADPTAEAWATATAEAQQEEAESEAEATPEGGATPEGETSTGEDGEDSDSASGQEEAEQNGEDEAAEDDESEATPTPEPTPGDEEIRATAESNQLDHERFLLDRADLSEDEFIDMVIHPEIAREKIRDHLAEDIPARAEQVQAAHILVATEDAANQIYEDLSGDGEQEFADVAEEQSTDSQTAPNGGDLGWFPRDVMVQEFDEVVFDLEEGEISEPFETEFGWHVATILDRADDRPIELQMLQQLRQQAFDEWLDEEREATDIDTGDIELPEDPGAAPGQFQPPAGAPQPPQPEGQPQPEMEVPGGDEGSGDEADPGGSGDSDEPSEGEDADEN